MAARAQEGTGAKRATPALDPRVPVLVQPWKRMVEDGLIAELAVTFTPTGTTSVGKATTKLVAVANSGLNETQNYPLGRLLQVAESGNLIPKAGKKGQNATPAVPLPAKSLVKTDLTDAARPGLQARINSIAAACGGGPLTGRVRSAGRFMGTATTSYQTWWDAADGDLRALSLSVGKNYSSFTNEEKSRLLGLQCPFRGTLEFKVADEDAAAPPASDIVTMSGAGGPAAKQSAASGSA